MYIRNTRPQNNGRRLKLRHLGSAIFLTCLLFLIWKTPVLASSQTIKSSGPTIQAISVGIDGTYRDGNWIPLKITLNNTNTQFDGKLSVAVPTTTNYGSSAFTTYQQVVSLPPLSHKQLTMNIPITIGFQGSSQALAIKLIDNNGTVVTSQNTPLQSLTPSDVFIGLITGPDNANPNIQALSASLNNLSSIHIQTEHLSPATLPDNTATLRNFDLLILDNLTGTQLSENQMNALQSWVDQGGTLVDIGGPEWNATFKNLSSSLLPVTVTGSDHLAPGTHLLPVEIASALSQGNDTVTDTVDISVATAHPGTTTLLSANSVPLLVQGHLGQGSLYYLAYDPFLSPLVTWSNSTLLWKTIILRAQSNHVLSAVAYNSNMAAKLGLYSTDGMDGFLQALVPNIFPSPWIILGLLIGYILILGPVRMIIVRRTKRRDWSWRIVLVTIVLFSALSYGIALHEKGTAIVSNNIAVLQLSRSDDNGTTEHSTSYLGIFVPNQGDFQVQLPGTQIVQPLNNSRNFYNPSNNPTQQTTIVSQGNDTTVNLQGVDIWTHRSLTVQQDTHVKGGLSAHLTYQEQKVVGTITNTLPYALNDAYLLVGENYVSIGTLASGQTKQVNLTLSQNTNTPQGSLNDRITADRGVNIAQYTPPGSPSQISDDLHRHMYMLSAISGEYCGPGCYNNGWMGVKSVIGYNTSTSGGQSQVATQDPLLLPGVPATLIGWASGDAVPTNKVTINGNATPKLQEAFVQAPLDIQFSGSVVIPAEMVSTQITDVDVMNGGKLSLEQGSNPNIYCMSSSSATFEMTLPTSSALHNSQLSFTEAQNPGTVQASQGKPIQCNTTGAAIDANHLHVALYNWQTNTWDAQAFSSYTLNVNNADAYVGPGGRVLIRLDNLDGAQNPIMFTTPNLEVNTNVS